MTSLDPVQVKADAHENRVHELEWACLVAIRGFNRILKETEEPGEDSLVKIAGTAGRALAAMGAK